MDVKELTVQYYFVLVATSSPICRSGTRIARLKVIKSTVLPQRAYNVSKRQETTVGTNRDRRGGLGNDEIKLVGIEKWCLQPIICPIHVKFPSRYSWQARVSRTTSMTKLIEQPLFSQSWIVIIFSKAKSDNVL